VKSLLMGAAALIASTAAIAQVHPYTATLMQPLAAKKEIIANGNYWYCMGDTCTILSEPRDPISFRSCRELQRQVGDLNAYGTKEHPLDADKLAKCNAKS
jgi:hypothetical protein